jgi:hypothetical protein
VAFALHKPDTKEVDLMQRMLSALLMTAVMAAPMVVPTSALAREPRANATITLRVYDPYRRDYHDWDRREEREYRAYLAERHRSYSGYQRQRLAERRAYWRWRHEREERLEHERR